MARAYIGIGSNVGDRAAHVELARRRLSELPGTTLAGFSGVYETPPLGPIEQGPYLNAVAAIDTELPPHDLLMALSNIQTEAGRPPAAQRAKWGPRTLDLDILFYGERVIQEPGLTVPHPHLHERWFVLKPLTDVAPQLVHPVLQKSATELLQQYSSGTQHPEA